MLGYCYENGSGVPKCQKKVVEWYINAAELGDSNAMYRLGVCNIEGGDILKDENKTIEWYMKSAELGNSKAMFNLGVKNYKKSVAYFFEASKSNISVASYSLGICYSEGKGVQRDKKKAIQLFKKAVYNDNEPCSIAQYELACLYADGEGVKKDLCKAADLFLKASEQNDPDAQLRIAKCFEDGAVVEQSDEKASHWYIKAADAGIEEALYEASQCFEYGIGVDEDEIKAVSYYRLAVEKGIKEADRHLRKLERNISLNHENEELISGLIDRLRQQECELAAEREKQKNGIQMAGIESQMLEIKQMMISNFNDLRAVSNDTNRVVKDTNSRVGEIQTQLSSLSDYLVKDLPNVLKEKRRESGCNSLTTININTDELSENDEKNDLIRNSREELEKRMGGIWSEFSPDTRNSLVSAMTLFRAYRNVSDECFDFSSIGILATSALENERRRIFLIDFQKFALNQAEGDISALPKQLRYYDSKNGQWILSDPEHFALGQIPFLFGQQNRDKNDQEDIKCMTNYREAYLGSIVDRDIKEQKNFSSFIEYFTKAVFSEGSDVPEKHWMCYCPGGYGRKRKSKNKENPALELVLRTGDTIVFELDGHKIQRKHFFKDINIYCIYCSGIRVRVIKYDIFFVIVDPEETIKQVFVDGFNYVNDIEPVRVGVIQREPDADAVFD